MTEGLGGDPEAETILDEVMKDAGAPSVEEAAPEVQTDTDESAQAPAHSSPAEKFIEIAGQKFKTPDEAYRWAERLFNRNSQLGREHAEFKKRYDRAIKFQETIDKEGPEYVNALVAAETEYRSKRSQGASKEQATKSALETLPPEVREAVEKVKRIEEKQAADEEKKAADAAASELRADIEAFNKAHPDLTKAKRDKVLERILNYEEKYRIQLAPEDALAEIEVEELRAQNKAKSDQLRKVKADSDIGPGQGTPHAARKRDLSKEGTDEEFAQSLVSELQAGGHIPSE